MKQIEKPGYFAVLPANVRYDKRLKPIERLLYAEITSLCNKDGYCWATSGYFAELYGITREHISRCISHLTMCDYVEVEVDKCNGNSRKIYLTGLVIKKSQGCDLKITRGVTNKSQGCDLKITQNNVSNYNKPSKDNNSVNKEKEKGKEKLARYKYGRYNNVLLSDIELETLKSEFPSDWQVRIDRLSEYCESTGKIYKNHLATIRNWARRDEEKVGVTKPSPVVRRNDSRAGYNKALETLGINESEA